MGFFSWKTMDTNRSIPSSYSSRKTFPVTMTDDKGNKWTEKEYEGYGVFGGKDFYELLAEMNGGGDRGKGITIAFDDKAFISPNLNQSDTMPWVNQHPRNCEHQGFFYDDRSENEED